MAIVYFDRVYKVRVNEELVKKVNEIISKAPDRFPSDSQVIRAGIMALWTKEVGDNGK